MTRTVPTAASPFLKWAGGKGQLLDDYAALYPATFETYHEPFLGGGAVFFDLYRRGRLRAAHLSDVNADLVLAYEVVKEAPDALIEQLMGLRATHDEAHFYAARQRFNEAPLGAVERAAHLIYLNKTGFNGLFRVNSKGRFNVPFGRYVNPAVVHPTALHAASAALRCATLAHGDFGTVLEQARPGDFVYFDPPYVPLTSTAYFTDYAKEGFGPAEQERLAQVFRTLAERGVLAMLSNHDTPLLRELYGGFDLRSLSASRSINSRGDRRSQPVAELVVRSWSS